MTLRKLRSRGAVAAAFALLSAPAFAAESPDALFARFRERGDPDALAALFDATAPGLHRLAGTLTPDPATAEDAVQETFLAALAFADRFDATRPVVPWLVGILRHKVEYLRRRELRRPDPCTRQER